MPASEPPMSDATEPEISAELLASLQELPSKTKRRLGGWLIVNSDEPEDDPDEVRAAWKTELTRRIERIRSGEAKLLTPEEVEQNVERRLADEERSRCS